MVNNYKDQEFDQQLQSRIKSVNCSKADDHWLKVESVLLTQPRPRRALVSGTLASFFTLVVVVVLTAWISFKPGDRKLTGNQQRNYTEMPIAEENISVQPNPGVFHASVSMEQVNQQIESPAVQVPEVVSMTTVKTVAPRLKKPFKNVPPKQPAAQEPEKSQMASTGSEENPEPLIPWDTNKQSVRENN
jgi:hypothetical protein